MPFAEERSRFAVHQISRDLQHPCLIRVRRDSTQGHSASSQFNHEEDVLSRQALPTPHLNRKEITGCKELPVSFEKHRPRDAAAAGRRRLNQMILENATNRAAPNLDFQIEQSAMNSCVSPTRILLSHAHDELLDVDSRSRSSRSAPLQECPFLGYQVSMPTQQGRRRNDGIEIAQLPSSDFFCERSERAPFSISEQDAPSFKSRSQRTILGFQIVYLRRGMPLKPACHACGDQRQQVSRLP